MDESQTARQLVGGAYSEILDTVRAASEAYEESNGHITPEIDDAMRRIRFLFQQMERPRFSGKRSLVTTDEERGT